MSISLEILDPQTSQNEDTLSELERAGSKALAYNLTVLGIRVWFWPSIP